MPVAGIKNFVRAMQKLGRARKSVLEKVVQNLQSRQAYKDVKNNISILTSLVNLRVYV